MKVKKLRFPWWSVILFLIFIGNCKAIKRIQRRFMWKQMDDTMDGLFDSMASSARAMKNMFGDFMPGLPTTPTPLVVHSNVLDYLPSETTKIKYIIRNPSTNKPMKIIKMSPPKKVIKIITIPKPIVENKIIKPKLNFPNAESLRQLEKEQEILAEGRLPQFDTESLKDHNDIIKGHIQEFSNDWKPVTIIKAQPMSELHTNISDEPLPEPEKIVYEPQANEISYDYQKQKNSYEVTEQTSEETDAVPFSQTRYQNSRGFVPIRGSHQHTNRQHNARVGSTHSATTTTTSTTEAPNYPSSFLKKQRERPSNLLKHHLKNLGLNDSEVEHISSKTKIITPTHTLVHVKSENWPIIGPTLLPNTTEPSRVEKTHKAEPLVQPTTAERLKSRPIKKPENSKPRDIRQRGTIKFGDKLAELYK